MSTIIERLDSTCLWDCCTPGQTYGERWSYGDSRFLTLKLIRVLIIHPSIVFFAAVALRYVVYAGCGRDGCAGVAYVWWCLEGWRVVGVLVSSLYCMKNRNVCPNNTKTKFVSLFPRSFPHFV